MSRRGDDGWGAVQPNQACLPIVTVDTHDVIDRCVDAHAGPLGEPVDHTFTIRELYTLGDDPRPADARGIFITVQLEKTHILLLDM
jgi:hypothetical protein